jgi:hypothetical protein
MSTLDEITKEKQRIGDSLARVDAQRGKLVGRVPARPESAGGLSAIGAV